MSDPQPNISRDLLGRGHSPVSASRIFKEKVLDKPLFLRPTEPEPLDARSQRQRERAHELARRRKSQKPKPLTARQKRALGIYEVPREQQKYAIYKPLHAMWCSYMREILGLDKAEGENGSRPSAAYITPQGAGPKIASADFHGAEIEIVRSRCVSRVGLRGIVVKDTKFVFEIITPTNQMKSKLEICHKAELSWTLKLMNLFSHPKRTHGVSDRDSNIRDRA